MGVSVANSLSASGGTCARGDIPCDPGKSWESHLPTWQVVEGLEGIKYTLLLRRKCDIPIPLLIRGALTTNSQWTAWWSVNNAHNEFFLMIKAWHSRSHKLLYEQLFVILKTLEYIRLI